MKTVAKSAIVALLGLAALGFLALAGFWLLVQSLRSAVFYVVVEPSAYDQATNKPVPNCLLTFDPGDGHPNGTATNRDGHARQATAMTYRYGAGLSSLDRRRKPTLRFFLGQGPRLGIINEEVETWDIRLRFREPWRWKTDDEVIPQVEVQRSITHEEELQAAPWWREVSRVLPTDPPPTLVKATVRLSLALSGPSNPGSWEDRRGTLRVPLSVYLNEAQVAACQGTTKTAEPPPAATAAPPRKRDEKLRSEYAKIPAGGFEMGCVPAENCSPSFRDSPRHHVTIAKAFWMMRTLVTVGEYKKYAAGQAMPKAPEGNAHWAHEDEPIVNLSWSEATAYCEWKNARLPSEAEWEYAARATHDGWMYVWGNQATPMVDGEKQANVGDESAKKKFGTPCAQCRFHGYDDGYVEGSPVGVFPPNGFGLFDMAGNVWEWCEDARHDSYTGAPSDGHEWAGGDTFSRMVRGGSFLSDPSQVIVSHRESYPAHYQMETVGVRCVRDTRP